MAQDPGKAVDGGNGNEKERGAKDHICTSFARRRARRARRREFCDVEKNLNNNSAKNFTKNVRFVPWCRTSFFSF